MHNKRSGSHQVMQRNKISTGKLQLAAFLLLVPLFCLNVVFAGQIRVAAASNFSAPIREVASQFQHESGHKVVLAFGSTGKHFAQIKNGAPFEIFFAADIDRPKRLEAEGLVQPGSRFTYAVGKLVLWSPRLSLVDDEGQVLNADSFAHIAIANPRHAPYGKAAQQILQAKGLWEKLQDRIVRGEHIGQAFQFVKSGNAELGFIAYSQIMGPDRNIVGSYWIPPQSLYNPIEQQAVLLADNAIARQFLAFVKSEQARMIIQSYGYGTTR